MREAFRNMARGRKPTPYEIEMDVLDALRQGATQKRVSLDLGISQSTVSKIKRKYELMERHEEERRMNEKVLAGDKENGRLVCIGADTYEGTCRRANGKMAKKVFRCASLKLANSQWERWCEGIRAEDSKAEVVAPVQKDAGPRDEGPAEQVAVEAGPKVEDLSALFPIRKDVGTDEVLELLSSVNADAVTMDITSWNCLVAFIRERTRVTPATDVADGVRDAGVTDQDEVYVTYIPEKGPHALFTDYEDAMRVTDTLNEALKFAGVDQRYEVCDVRPWRG